MRKDDDVRLPVVEMISGGVDRSPPGVITLAHHRRASQQLWRKAVGNEWKSSTRRINAVSEIEGLCDVTTAVSPRGRPSQGVSVNAGEINETVGSKRRDAISNECHERCSLGEVEPEKVEPEEVGSVLDS